MSDTRSPSMLKCYICSKLVPRGVEYRDHVASHILTGDPLLGMQQPDASPHRTMQERRPSTQPNAFHSWFDSRMQHIPNYTTVDGQRRGPDSQESELLQAAQLLRHTTKQNVVTIVEQFKGFPTSSAKKACLDLVLKAPVFPGLVAFIYTHLVVCSRHGWLSGWLSSDNEVRDVSDLKGLVERWAERGDIRCLLAFDRIKEELLRILHATKSPGPHKCNLGLLNGRIVLDHDVLNLAALAALCITGPQKMDILEQRGGQSEKFVELFHNLLEANVELEESYRRYFFNALVLFTKKSGHSPSGIHIPEGSVKDLKLNLAGGGFGRVHKGEIGIRVVAVKELRRKSDEEPSRYKKEVSKEAIVWRHLRHPNCLPLYGVYNMARGGQSIETALISPWMDQGTLFKYLERKPNASRILLMTDVVRGLDYLHSMRPHIAHRDIKPDNILITRKGRACLADFGLASTFDTDDYFRTATFEANAGGTLSYMAPEILDALHIRESVHKLNKRKCDMYALGCTIYAAYTSRHPFQDMNPAFILTNVVVHNRRPAFPDGKISLDMWSFVENLWGRDPSKRLTAQEALGWMEAKASQEGVDSSLAPLEEEWKWKGPRVHKCLWSVLY